MKSGHLERELGSWLRSFEPAGLPVGARLRLSADLLAESERAVPARLRLRGALAFASSLAASLLLLGFAALLMLGLAGRPSTGMSLGPQTAPSTSPIEEGQLPEWNSLPWMIGASLLVGAFALLPRVRRAASSLRIWLSREGAATIRPLPRSMRQMSRPAWALVAIAILVATWSGFLFSKVAPQPGLWLLWDVLAATWPVLLALAILLRYRTGGRARSCMLTGGLALAVADVCVVSEFAISSIGMDLYGWPWSAYGLQSMSSILWAIGWVALALGIAGQGVSMRRLPIRATGLVVGILFFLNLNGSLDWIANWPWLDIYGYVSGFGQIIRDLSDWLAMLSWAWIAWIGLNAGWRRGGGRSWNLILIGASIMLCSQFVQAALFLHPVDSADVSSLFWQIFPGVYLMGLVCLLLALLIGLRPVADEAPLPQEAVVAEP